MDPRWRQLAAVLAEYSVNVAPGERVMIAMGEVETLPLTHALYEACIRRGAYPQVQFLSETLRHSLLRYGNDDQLGWIPAGWQKTRWCLVRVPNAAFAFQAGVDLESLEEMFFAGCLLDWEAVSRRWPRAHGAGPCLSSVWRRQPIGHPLGYRQRHPQ
ncbi:MAG: aminopeptidase [Caldilinea sp.]|nr:aminopeptidase [Caldilinea sp.]